MNAEALHQKGREAGQAGNYAEAIAFFEQAQIADPEWPYPAYDLAFTYLLQQNYEKALYYYEHCDKLAPNGFFTAKTAVWTLRKEQEAIFTKGLYLTYVQLEWQEEADKIKILDNILSQFPNFSPAYKSLQSLHKDPKIRLELADKGLSLEADDETYSMLLLNKALVLNHFQKQAEAKQLLIDYLASPRQTLSAQHIAKSILEQWQ